MFQLPGWYFISSRCQEPPPWFFLSEGFTPHLSRKNTPQVPNAFRPRNSLHRRFMEEFVLEPWSAYSDRCDHRKATLKQTGAVFLRSEIIKQSFEGTVRPFGCPMWMRNGCSCQWFVWCVPLSSVWFRQLETWLSCAVWILNSISRRKFTQATAGTRPLNKWLGQGGFTDLTALAGNNLLDLGKWFVSSWYFQGNTTLQKKTWGFNFFEKHFDAWNLL